MILFCDMNEGDSLGYAKMENLNPRAKKLKIFSLALVGIVLIIIIILYRSLFSAPQSGVKAETFVLSLSAKTSELGTRLKTSGFVRSTRVFDYLLGQKSLAGGVAKGSYEISKSMNVFQIVAIFSSSPSDVWVVIPPGLRKEEIAGILSESLKWTPEQKNEWINVDTNDSADYFEGVYFPDTYLIPRDDTSQDVAKRLRAHFEEKFAPLSKQAAQQNIKWTTALKVASLVQREAGGKEDMPIIAGIIWNRVAQKMRLQIDASVQYARGDKGKGWWAPVTHSDLSIDSPYNTYKYAGLPPHPIDNPGLDAISASVNPADTTCLYYIHDSSRKIHCATTNAEQNANIAKYLK